MAENNTKIVRPHIEGLSNPPHFSNAVTIEGGKLVHISGMLDPEGDHTAQLAAVYGKLKIALAGCGATPADVIRQRVFVVDLVPEHREIVVSAMGEFYGNAKPASTLVGVSALIVPGALVEIDVTAAINT